MTEILVHFMSLPSCTIVVKKEKKMSLMAQQNLKPPLICIVLYVILVRQPVDSSSSVSNY